MFGDGKLQDVIIQLMPRVHENAPSMFSAGSIVTLEYDRLMVWCEHGYKAKFEQIAGVFNVSEDKPEPRYIVAIDPRYSTQWVMKEIEGVVKTEQPTQTQTGLSIHSWVINEDKVPSKNRKKKKG